jgi:hypothetical protein
LPAEVARSLRAFEDFFYKHKPSKTDLKKIFNTVREWQERWTDKYIDNLKVMDIEKRTNKQKAESDKQTLHQMRKDAGEMFDKTGNREIRRSNTGELVDQNGVPRPNPKSKPKDNNSGNYVFERDGEKITFENFSSDDIDYYANREDPNWSDNDDENPDDDEDDFQDT